MRIHCTVLAWLGISLLVHAQEALPLWSNGAPGALGHSTNDIPTITPFLAPADKATGAAIVVCPGGGYGGLASHEGADYALYLNQHGITAFVLTGRHGSRRTPKQPSGSRDPLLSGHQPGTQYASWVKEQSARQGTLGRAGGAALE